MVYGPNPTACRMQWCHGVVGRWLFGRDWGRSYSLEAFLIVVPTNIMGTLALWI